MNIKKQDGFVSVIIIFILFAIIIVAGYGILDVLGYIDVPNEYSIAYYCGLKEDDDVYKNESLESPHRRIREKVKENVVTDYDSEFVITNSVDKNTSKNKDDEVVIEKDYSYMDYYYSQLNDYAKLIYNGIVDNRENLKTGTYTIKFGKAFNDLLNTPDGSEILNSSFQSAVNAVLLDNPDIYFLDITKMYLLTKSTTYAFTGTTYEVSVGPTDGGNYLNTGFSKTDIDFADNQLENLKKIITHTYSNDRIEQIKEVHDYLVEKLEYDSNFEHDNIYNLYGALVNEVTVCEGYAKAFKYIMDDLGVPCVVICGTAKNSKNEIENHAWNYVKISDKWYAIDVTWDDPILIGGGVLSEESKYKYYLKGSKDFFIDHTEDGKIVEGVEFSYPNLNLNDF